MLTQVKSKAVSEAILRYNKRIVDAISADALASLVEETISSLDWTANRGLTVNYFPEWHPPAIVVTAWDADATDIVDKIVVPLSHVLQRKVTTEVDGDFKIFFNLPSKQAGELKVVVQIVHPVGCEIIESQETVRRIKCA